MNEVLLELDELDGEIKLAPDGVCDDDKLLLLLTDRVTLKLAVIGG